MFEVRFGTEQKVKTVTANDLDRALSMYEKAKRFATKHGLTWTISIWDNYNGGHWLIQSDTINPSGYIGSKRIPFKVAADFGNQPILHDEDEWSGKYSTYREMWAGEGYTIETEPGR